jgi:uncharacterized membrane protein YkgB
VLSSQFSSQRRYENEKVEVAGAAFVIVLFAVWYAFRPEGLTMEFIIKTLTKLGIRKHDLDYHFIRASMVIVFLFFGYSKWFEYEAQGLIPYISHGPLIFWLYPVFGIRGAGRLLGVSEWTFGSLLVLGFWNKKLGILGEIGSFFSFVATLTIIPFLPNAWATSAGGFPAMTDSVAFLMKDLILLAASVYLLRQDVIRVSVATEHLSVPFERGERRTSSLVVTHEE